MSPENGPVEPHDHAATVRDSVRSHRAWRSACAIVLCIAITPVAAEADESRPEPDAAAEALSAPARADPEGELVEYYGTRVGDDLEPVKAVDVDPWMEPWFRDYDAKEEVKRAEAMIEYLIKKGSPPEEIEPAPESPPD